MVVFCFNIFSQILGITSGVLLAKYGVPSMTELDLIDFRSIDTPEDEMNRRKKRLKKYRRISRFALILLIASFFIQISLNVFEFLV